MRLHPSIRFAAVTGLVVASSLGASTSNAQSSLAATARLQEDAAGAPASKGFIAPRFAVDSPPHTIPVHVETSTSPSEVAAQIPSKPAGRDDGVHSVYVEPETEKTGFILDFAEGISAPAGSYRKGDSAGSFGPGASTTLTFGYYFTQHLGASAGGRFSYKHAGTSDCTNATKDQSCGGFTYQFPVVAELAFIDRKDGPYLRAGVALFSGYSIYTASRSSDFHAPFDYKLGLGYRWSQHRFNQEMHAPSWASFDVFFNTDVGAFNKVDSREIDAPRAAIHWMFDLGFSLHFTG